MVTAVRFSNGQEAFPLTTAAQNIHIFPRKSPLCRSHFFEWLKTAISSNACGMSTLKSPLLRESDAPRVHPRLRKRLARCTLDCGFKTSESPALRGFVAERGPITGTSLYLVLKSNGPHRSKNPPVKFGFSPKTVPANIAKKLPAQRCSKPHFIAFFSLSHKRPTFAFTSESEHTLAFAQRIAHKGTHGETGAFPPSVTAGLCVASEIALNAAFATLDSATLLYTYISRFSVNPHYRQQLYLRPSFILTFNFSHKRPTFAFTGESGYTLGSPRKIAHKGTHAETGGVSDGGGITTLGAFRTFTNIPGPGIRTANFAAFGSWSEALLKDAESLRDSDALMRVAVPRRRGPAGLRIHMP